MLTIVITILVVVSGTSFMLGLVCNADSEVGLLVVDISFLIKEVIVVLTTVVMYNSYYGFSGRYYCVTRIVLIVAYYSIW